ncbi:MAG TPA: protein-methionine-sulfoxide reductase heme-binding subunit MsrQ [Bryobacteraceae bacterium]|jgi:sulfoxide reductase heme-binding subunit YedZ|nr:protein-methionine-sulfoxide reductase heme-binding subunit MsrQ [Bryobacteraceae bacterium]
MLRSRWTKALIWLLCMAPLGWMVARALGFGGGQMIIALKGGRLVFDGGIEDALGNLTANPLEYVTHFTGDWTIRMIVITLGVTPLRKLLHLPDLIRFRRMIGLFAFFYGCLHFSTWLFLDKLFDPAGMLQGMLKDVVKRPFITAGFAALLAMLPLAITSTTGWIRRLGGKRWQRLHRLVYFSGIAGVVHYYWLVKSDIRLPLMYGAMVAVLLAYRIGAWLIGRAARPARKRAVPAVT